MEKQYNPVFVEQRIYQEWLDKKYFHADENSKKPPYSIVIPPPNVTGILHMGHVLNNTIQDILIRYKRMSGFETLWMPGTDHAGIATQNVVERALAKDEKKTRQDVGRDEFVRRVWAWKEQYGSTIVRQLKLLGCSCDWERERFTMDEGLSHAVNECFVSLYERGLVYQGKYIINWCPRCHTALSDEENIYKDKKGHLWHFSYPLADGSGSVVVATTRPETMLGDTAVAVNPTDERYAHLVGKKVRLPLADREISIIADDLVEKDFGTGCVKVTPAHDPNDFAMGERHHLDKIIIMDTSGTMNENVPEKYRGLDRFACRKAVLADLDAAGLLVKTDDHEHTVGHCQRCETVTEPYLSKQWFVKYSEWVGPTLAAIKNGELRLHPEKWEKTFIHWMENIRDWCISRQLWWGHRIPVWYCTCGKVIVSRTTPEACPQCNGTELTQDEDVLDTWFSSWLWPFSTMGWPDKTETLARFYPTNTLVTAPDIIFFWVARMVFAGIEFTGKLPFADVYFNSLVRDMKGRKMSKSLGNSSDPIDLIATYGADALRYTMVSLAPTGQDVLFSDDKCEIGRNFCNKLWNASRFLLGNIQEQLTFTSLPPRERLQPVDRWVLSKLSRTITSIHASIESYRLGDACRTIYDFAWHDFCDWYIEAKKKELYREEDPVAKQDALNFCSYVLAHILKLMHPVMPFITEEIWANLRKTVSYPQCIDHESIMCSAFPIANNAHIDIDTEQRFELLQEVIVALRTIRSENNIPPEKVGTAIIIPANDVDGVWLREQVVAINQFAKLSQTTIDAGATKPEFAGQSVVRGSQIFLELEGLIDKKVETDKLTKEIARMEGLVESTGNKLSNDNFAKRAPADVVAREKEKFESMKATLEKLKKNLAGLA